MHANARLLGFRAALARPTAAFLLLTSVTASASEYSVRPDGLGDFPTIQAAVDAASPGDTLFLEDGTFTGAGNRDITFGGKDLLVRSRHGAAACTLDTEGSVATPHRAFRLDDGESAASEIDGLTIVGGYTAGPFPECGGAGILVTTNTSPTIRNCVFDGNVTGFEGFGAGLLAFDGCDVRIYDCVFRNGISGWYGGGFTLRLHSDGIVERCLVIDNYALHAGGGASITNSDAIVTDCVFVGNEISEADGGGVLVKAGEQPIFTGCIFAGNRAYFGAAVGIGNYPEVTMIDCLFEGNVATGAGGAIEVGQEPSILHLDNCTLVNNQSGGLAGHVMLGNQATFTMRNSIVRGICGVFTPFFVDASASADVDCCILEGGSAAFTGAGSILYGPDNRDLDPLFCATRPCGATPYPIGDWTLDAASPAAPGASSCGLVGAFPVACSATSAQDFLTPSTWGAIKSRYLGERTR